MGSGKTYARNMFEKICKEKKIEAIFIDVDEVRRNILKQEKIDTTQLNKRIYNKKEEMEQYKQFMNPKIRKYVMEEINKRDKNIFIEWALLIEDSFYDMVDSTIMIDCEENIQMERLEKADLKKEEIRKRIDLQLTNKQKVDRLKELKKEFFIMDTSQNPKEKEYEEMLRKEGIL